MTVEQAIKKYKLQPVSVSVSKVKAKELNVEEVLYMNVQKNKYAYIVKDGARGIMLYSDERSLYTKLYKGLKSNSSPAIIAHVRKFHTTKTKAYNSRIPCLSIELKTDYKLFFFARIRFLNFFPKKL